MDFSPYLGLARNPETLSGLVPEGESDSVVDKTLLYLDDIPELPLVRIQQPDNKDVRATARMQASNVLNADLKAFLGNTFQSRPLYSGLLGKVSYTQFLQPISQTKRVLFNMRYLTGGELLIRSVGIIVSDNLTDQLIGLYKVGQDDPIKSKTVPTIPARSTTQYSVGEAWRIPMDGGSYELRTVLPQGVKVADNPLACGGCGGMGALHGMITNCCDGRADGFVMTLGGSCDYDPLLLQLMENDRTRLVIAYMLAYQTGYILCVPPASGQIERATVLSETDMANAAAQCRQEYLNRLSWLKMEVPKLGLSTDNTCFQAVAPHGWNRSGAFR
ncbi:hypothetical protein [Spirosoma litoris]